MRLGATASATYTLFMPLFFPLIYNRLCDNVPFNFQICHSQVPFIISFDLATKNYGSFCLAIIAVATNDGTRVAGIRKLRSPFIFGLMIARAN